MLARHWSTEMVAKCTAFLSWGNCLMGGSRFAVQCGRPVAIDDREIPGLTPVEWREYCYVSDDGSGRFLGKGLFQKLTDYSSSSLPESGGAITENCNLWLPSGELLHALSCKGDIDGWRRHFEQAAEALGLLIGRMVGGRIVLSDGRIFDLSDCRAVFY